MNRRWRILAPAAILWFAMTGVALSQGVAPGFDLLYRLNEMRQMKHPQQPDQSDPFQAYLAKHPKDLKDLRAFGLAHPEFIKQLETNPFKVLNPDWRSQHPAVNEFFAHHSGLWKAGVTSLSQFWTPEFAHFLRHNPKLEAAIRTDPELLYNRPWVAKHRRLANFMKTHPKVWTLDQPAPQPPKGKSSKKKLVG
ncbi:MAG: hypothetical protein ACREQI_10785 [Candidatus Binataceae bacterium]